MNKPKFRAWDKVNKKMIYWNRLLNGHNLRNVFMRPEMCGLILMQYTGLKDKNGKLYCQNDLVRYKGKIYRLIKGTYTFELVGFYESYQDNPNDFFSEQAYLLGEIVGDFYTNPELLNEVEK